MSYGCSDFVGSIEEAADAHKLPPLTEADLAMLGIDPEDLADNLGNSDDKLRALAEQVCGAIHDVGRFRTALEGIVKCGGPAALIAQEALKL